MMQTFPPATKRDAPFRPARSAVRRAAVGATAVVATLLLLAGPGAAQQHGDHGDPAVEEGGQDAPHGSLPPSVELPVDRDSLLRVDPKPEEGTIEVVIGPVELPANLNHYRAPIQMMTWPVEGWLHGYSWELRTADGDTLPESMLHHVGFIDPDRRQLFSPIAQRVVAAGNETKSPMLPRMIGVPMSDTTRLLVVGMFANPTDRPVDEAYLHVNLRVSPKDRSVLPRMSVRPIYLDVMGPLGAKSFSVPPGRTVESWEGSPAVDARILGLGGHAHDYAKRLQLVDLTTGDTIWRAEPVVEEGYKVVNVPTDHVWRTGGVKIHADHRYRVEIVYENPTDRPAPHGGMGVVAGVAWTGDEAWPAFDRLNATYAADLWNTLTAPRRSSASHAHAHDGSARGEVQDTVQWKQKIDAGTAGEEIDVSSALEDARER